MIEAARECSARDKRCGHRGRTGLAAGLAVGVLVSIFQTVTSIQDHVLAFIPRTAAVFAVFALTFPWMLRVLTGFAHQLIVRLPELIR